MEIEFIRNDNFLDIKESAIRNMDSYCSDCGNRFSTNHFQALVVDRRKKKDKSISCRIRYENERGEFIGLDEDTIYGSGNSNEIVISMTVTVPENAVKAKVDLEERSYPGISEYSDYFIVAGVVILVAFAAKGLFNW